MLVVQEDERGNHMPQSIQPTDNIMRQMPRGRPPETIPARPGSMQGGPAPRHPSGPTPMHHGGPTPRHPGIPTPRHHGGSFRPPISALSMRGCIGRFTYVWLRNRQEFWMFPIQVGRNSVIGFRWDRRHGWTYIAISLNRIDFFTC